MRQRLGEMLAAEQSIIDRQLKEITRDPPLVRAEIRAELLREIIKNAPDAIHELEYHHDDGP